VQDWSMNCLQNVLYTVKDARLTDCARCKSRGVKVPVIERGL